MSTETFTTLANSDPIAVDHFYKLTPGVGLELAKVVSADVPVGVIGGYELKQNYPNPFNPSTRIEFTLPVQSKIRMVLINILGQVVKEIANGDYAAGKQKVEFNASDLASGVYFYKLQAGNFTQVKKMVLLK